jgi:hypothetical protein
VKKIQSLDAKLTKMSYELLQSFEMKSVFTQLMQAVERAQDRCSRMGEAAAMAREELEQRQRERSGQQQAAEAAGAEAEASTMPNQLLGMEAQSSTPSSPSDCRPRFPSSSSQPDVTGDRLESIEKVDWDRLMTERETTSAALSTGIQRVITLEREVKELDAEREMLDSQGSKDLGGLRGKLRQTVSAMSKVFHAASSSTSDPTSGAPLEDMANAAAAEGLFKRRVDDLQATVAERQAELARSISNERALKRAINARRTALRSLLHQGATADLFSTQCGPLQLAASADAERRALQLAVEEQLSCNLSLCNSYGLGQHPRPLAILSKVPKTRRR